VTLEDDLRSAVLTRELSDKQLRELMGAGHEVSFGPGDELFHEGRPADEMWVLLDGTIELSRRSGGQQVAVATMKERGQWAGGFTAWTATGADAGYRASGRALAAGRAFVIPSAELGRLVGGWLPFGKHVIMGVYGTVRSIDSTAREQAKLVALGTHAARLAHELNNPAAASLRAVDGLRQACSEMMLSLGDLAAHAMAADPTMAAGRFVALDRLRLELHERSVVHESPVERMDREEIIGNWLEDRDVHQAWDIADVLVSAGADIEWLDRVASVVDMQQLGPAVRWVSATLNAGQLLDQLADTTSRIANLIDAAKSYSQMDRAAVQDIDVRDGIESTLTMLAPNLSGIAVERSYATDLPKLEVFASELNQVWTNLISNSVDAMDGAGSLRLATRLDGDYVVVEVTDSGHGIPAEALEQVFEPFFTTKPLTKGIGLGLDITRRIVAERHGGSVNFVSRPGETTATVRLPIRQ
jgi:signal transduction histidine kinase